MKWHSRWWQFGIMILPAACFYIVYLLLPVALSLYYSFTDFAGLGHAHFVGTANYRRMASDPVFFTSLRNTFIVVAAGIFVLLPLGFLLGLLMSERIKGATLLRSLIFAPAIMAPILVGLIWVFVLDPRIGLINASLLALGLPWRPQWIGGTTLTPYSVASLYVWEQVGFVLIIFYAGLRMMPREVLAASTIDGASRIQQLRYITIPMLRETFRITTVLIVTGAFRVFELVYELTGGGPVHTSEVLMTYMYFTIFQNQDYGYGMAIAVATSLLALAVSVVYLRFSRRQVV
jgi:raffinose/stachyose/melibiose transport system permease protein